MKAAYTEDLTGLIGNAAFWDGDADINAIQAGQHWSGTNEFYLDYWSGNAWSKKKTKQIYLPVGKYVFVAAGRGSAGTTPYMKVNDATVEFPHVGDTGKGINTSGEASLDGEDFTYNKIGRGWQWRYIEFEVTDASQPVSLEVGGSAAGNNWMSIADIALYTKEETTTYGKEYVDNYNKVKDTYKTSATDFIGDVSAWSGGMVLNLGDQHWKGASYKDGYWEQPYSNYNSGNGWSQNKTTSVLLPKGKYALVASCRAEKYVLGYIKVNDLVVSIPAKSGNGFGIDVDGNATFDSNATYATEQGRGWEWRTLEFEVTDDTKPVTIEIGGTAPKIAQQWLSISDVTLLADGVDTSAAFEVVAASLKTANSLLDSPMNAIVLDGLKQAIAGANASQNTNVEEIGAAKKILDEAISKANTSISQYEVLKAELDKAESFDEAGKAKFEAEAKDVIASYNDRTYAGDWNAAKTTITNALAEGAKAQTTEKSDMTFAVPDYACSNSGVWKISAVATDHKYQYDTWSDAAGMAKGYLEYWRAAGTNNKLADATITNQVTGLYPGLYKVSLYIHANHEALKVEPEGVTFFANDTKQEVKGTNSKFNGALDTFEVEAVVKEDGVLNIGIDVKNTNVNWVGFRDCKLTFEHALTYADYTEYSEALASAKATPQPT